MMKILLLILGGLFAFLSAVTAIFGLAFLQALFAAVIPWVVYNFALCPVFGFPPIKFFYAVGIVWALTFVVNLIASPFKRSGGEK